MAAPTCRTSPASPPSSTRRLERTSCSSWVRAGHHADVGGLTPGSTPPGSATLEDEGVVIDDFLLVEEGRFREREFRALLTGAKYPARSPDVNVADIKAQVAANETGVGELRRAVREFGLATVQSYMRHVMDNAEESVRASSPR
jgi:5-oxoprolinase (ATP-hydrolysing)